MSANPAISNVHVDADSHRMSIHWQTRDARFHFWLALGDHEYSTQTIYKNPPLGVKHNSPEDFRTRHLDGTKAANAKIIAQIMDIVQRGDMINKAIAEYEAQQNTEQAELTARIARQKHARELFERMRAGNSIVTFMTLNRDDMQALLEFAPKSE